jgi:hypothetical protein
MGLSKKKVKTTSHETVGPSAFAQPFINDAAGVQRGAYDQSRGVLDRYMPQVDRAAGYFGDVLGGQYLDGNPHLQGVIDSSNRDIADNVNSQFMDRFGSGYHTKTLANGLAENENRLRYQDYASERGYQDNAARAIPGVAATASSLPLALAGGYGDNISGLLGRYLTSDGTSTTKKSGGLLGSILQTAAGIGSQGLMASDVRLKTDIREVGATHAGLPLYSFRYQGEGPFYIGPMAHEVAETQPGALGPDIHGFKTVYYGELR